MIKRAKKNKSAKRKVFYFVWTFIYSIHQVVHRVIYQLFIPFVIHEEKSGTNNHHLILLGIQSRLSFTKRSLLEKSRILNLRLR